MKNLTQRQMYFICKQYQYIIVRFSDGDIVGVNCKLINIKRFENHKNSNQKTGIISFYPCSFMEYISKKSGFVKS